MGRATAVGGEAARKGGQIYIQGRARTTCLQRGSLSAQAGVRGAPRHLVPRSVAAAPAGDAVRARIARLRPFRHGDDCDAARRAPVAPARSLLSSVAAVDVRVVSAAGTWADCPNRAVNQNT